MMLSAVWNQRVGLIFWPPKSGVKKESDNGRENNLQAVQMTRHIEDIYIKTLETYPPWN